MIGGALLCAARRSTQRWDPTARVFDTVTNVSRSVASSRLTAVVDGLSCSKLIQMRIPHTKLSPATLRAVVQEFVTRDGTDYSSVERRVEYVLRKLEAGRAELYFDDDSETCNIVTVDNGENPPKDIMNGCR